MEVFGELGHSYAILHSLWLKLGARDTEIEPDDISMRPNSREVDCHANSTAARGSGEGAGPRPGTFNGNAGHHGGIRSRPATGSMGCPPRV